MAQQQEIGLSVPAVDIPLWLLDRRKLPKDWAKKLKAVHSKGEHIVAAIMEKKNISTIRNFIDSFKGSN